MSDLKSTNELLLRRRYPRRRLRRKISYLSSGMTYHGFCEEIGEGGAAIVVDQGLSVESWIVINFGLPESGEFISVRAQVKSSRKHESGGELLGLSFEGLKFEAKRHIRKFVTAKSSADH